MLIQNGTTNCFTRTWDNKMFKLMRKSNFGHLTGKYGYVVKSFGSYEEAAKALKTASSNTKHVYFIKKGGY